jgi:hypothetical protein
VRPSPAAEIVATLERVLARNPHHPGANHLYIHAVEASPEPGRAEAAADRLRGALPGAGHMVHMPSHIYIRVGRYADAEQVNVDAANADREYFARRQPSEIYRYMYYPHNIDFSWQMAAMEGRFADALAAAKKLEAEVPGEMIRHMSDAEMAPASPVYVLARFGRWDELLTQPMPPEGWLFMRGLWHYGRGLAFNAKGQPGEAERELQALHQAIEDTRRAHLASSSRRATSSPWRRTSSLARSRRAPAASTRRSSACRKRSPPRTPTGSPSRRPGTTRSASPGRRPPASRPPRRRRAVYREDLKRIQERLVALRPGAGCAPREIADAQQADGEFRPPGRGPTRRSPPRF